MKWVPHPLCRMNPIESLDLQKRISEMKEAKAAHQAESRIYEAAVAIQSKVRQMQATLQATITSSKQQGSSQTMIPKTQAGKLSKKTSEQSEQGKSLQSKQHNSEGLLQSEQSTTEKEFVQRDGSSNSGKSLRSKQDKQAQQDDSEKYLRSKPSKQGDLLQTTEIRELASPAELRRVSDHKINDNMPKISAKQRRAKKGVEGSSTKKGVKESSTYFTVGFKPQADTVFSRKTKSGPEQRNDIGSGKVAKEKKRRRGAEHSTSIHRLMVVSKHQHGETSLQSENQRGETKSDSDQSNEPSAAQSKNKFYFEQSGDFGISKVEHVNHVSGLGTKNGSKEECNLVGKDPLQTTRQSNNSKNGYSTSRGTKNFKEDCIRFGGKEYIAVNGDKRNQESRGFRGHKPEICDPQYQIRPSSSRAYYARMNRLDESLRCGETNNEQSYVLGDLYE
eukprot:CAMPEP_0185794602 /NCGR_PEP_ID=MMETSP1174-20130828/160101_1 /TAXON_ID=35687 /ORGANISM="Dictyocha speculum, Strain CCMP1381" /LENGTH=446 /DNA_ID=CAMNT_0028489841 /DNA_START=377 /DNA_END=1717 /DNA_ORIENTATION=+